MTTLKALKLRFKRYDINHPSGPNLRAIQATDDSFDRIFRYIEGLGFTNVEYDPVKNKLYIKQIRVSKLSLGGLSRKRTPMLVRAGDWVVQYHDGTWERLTNEEFQKILKPKDEPVFKLVKFGNDSIAIAEITEENGKNLVDYINDNGGRATVSARKPGDIRVYQRTSGKGWTKRDWRVGEPGDYVAYQANGEFFRVKRANIGTIEYI